ncbi:MFS transporter [Brevibacillus laterosporus]|uniref:Major facilitator superfamily protein n=1 Tax=Brevibacillus laterosporus LMG 15441 TaxID=1042163 RepID=A0A075R6M7_BRELA|nr:MFS transporter [Brevibacillus laterosporus]AIG26803.1 major facilitator superfamily protein [Brevibacillus laterosporus LMG 15441]RJL06052.1 MFS transporter [Brevibacillus laterosporus]
MENENYLKVIWKDKNFRLLFLGKFFSSVGDQLYLLGLPLLTLKLTGSGFALSLVVACEYLAKLLSSLWAGVIVDRTNRKVILIISALLQGGIVGLIYLLSIHNLLNTLTICILAAFVALLSSFYLSAEGVILPMLFNKKYYAALNAQFGLINSASRLIGPVIAGSLIGIFGVQDVLLIDVASFFILIVLAGFMSIPKLNESVASSKDSIFHSIKLGFVFLKENNFLIKVALGSFFINIALGPILALLVYFLQDSFNASSMEIGIIYACGSIGGLMMGFLVPKIKNHVKSFSVIFLINISFLGIGIISLGFSTNVVMASISNFINIAMIILFNVSYNTLVQQMTPINFLGRVNSVLFIISQISLPLSIGVSGLLTDLINIRVIYISLGISMVLIGLIFYMLVYKSIDIAIRSKESQYK